ncbi:MAG: hypothetical protein JSR58_07010 [Verrucomicrobia bacterium]|nr:hypothetical protein [Verrucomicrobiota bacterium]
MIFGNISGFIDFISLDKSGVQNYLRTHSLTFVENLIKDVLQAIPEHRKGDSLLRDFVTKIELIEPYFEKESLSQVTAYKTELLSCLSQAKKTNHVAKNVVHFQSLIDNQTPTKSKQLLQEIQEDIASINLNANNLSSIISKIKKKIVGLEKKGLKKTEIESLVTALNLLLLSHSYYHPSLFEERYYEFFAKNYPHTFAIVLSNNGNYSAITAESFRQDLLKVLQSKQSDMDVWMGKINAMVGDAQSALISKRLAYLYSQGYDLNYYMGSALPEHLPKILKAFEHMALKVALPFFYSEWERWKAQEPDVYSPEFLELIKNYPMHDPLQYIPDYLELIQGRYFNMLKMSTLGHLGSEDVDKHIQKANHEMQTFELADSFKKMFKINCHKQHLWMYENHSHIKWCYCQSLDVDREQNGGTCLQNSLERIRLLMENPSLESHNIEMGSSMKGRMIRATVKLAYHKMTREQANDFQMQTSHLLGLKMTESKEILSTEKTNVFSSMMDDLSKRVEEDKSSNFQCLLVLYDVKGFAHTFNLQIDKSNNVFRWMDDNFGVCEYDSAADFRSEFTKYLQAFYPEYTRFVVQTYAKL